VADVFNVEVLEDGTIKVDSGRVSAVNHLSAEGFLRFVNLAAGGLRAVRTHKRGLVGAVVHQVQHVAAGLGLGGGHHHHS
jgi:hypothetical protein